MIQFKDTTGANTYLVLSSISAVIVPSALSPTNECVVIFTGGATRISPIVADNIISELERFYSYQVKN